MGSYRSSPSSVALFTAVLLAASDLTIKWIMASIVLAPPHTVPVLPFFNLVLVYNRGVSFGFLGNLGSWGPTILSAAAAGIIGVLIIWLRRSERRGEAMGITMIIGGAVGNLVDRLHDGAVTDFLDFYVGSYHWPAFNAADMFITTGVVCMLLSGFRTDGRST